MIKSILISAFIIFTGLSRCLSVDLPVMKDVQLSVAVTTNVFHSGSSSICKTTLLNLSTNIIEVDPTSPDIQVSQLGLYLFDDTNKLYSLTPEYSSYLGAHYIVEIGPGDSFTETNTVTFYTTINPGRYTLKAERIFRLKKGKYCTSESNPVKVRIIK